MITHKDYFSGFCGKTTNLGNPRMYTTPTTAQIFQDYSFSVTGNIKGTLEACSLDGRLWLFRRSRRLAVVVCKLEDDKLSVDTARNLNNNDDVILARGLNWILTNNHIFMVDDNGNFSYASLFDDNIPDLFLYSPLRSVLGSSVAIYGDYSEYFYYFSINTHKLDPFTNLPWGKREDNGNSDGHAFFSKDTHLLYPPNSHSFEQCYSLLPEVGDWVLFENFLIRKPDHELSDSYHYMKNIRPLIPLELCDYKRNEPLFGGGYRSYEICVPIFGTGYNFDNRGVQVAVLNGQLWARGLCHIGKVYLIAAGFDKDSVPQEFYLYISPDFPNLNPDTSSKNDWLNVTLAPIGNNNICAYYSADNDPIHGGTCMASTNADILNTSGNECSWVTLSEHNGQLFFDYSSATALLLDDNGAKVFSESIDNPTTYQCSTFRQWIDPANSIQAVPDWGVLSNDDLALFFTEFQRGFHRSRLCSGQTLPLSAASYALKDNSNVRLSVDVSSCFSEAPNFQVKHSVSKAVNLNPLAWDTVFRQPVTLHYIGNFNVEHVIDEGKFFFHKDDLIVDPRIQGDPLILDHREYFDFYVYSLCASVPVLCSRFKLLDKAQYWDAEAHQHYTMSYYDRDAREERYYYHTMEMDLHILNLEQLSADKITFRHTSTEPIITGRLGKWEGGLSRNNFVFYLMYLEDSRYYSAPSMGTRHRINVNLGSTPAYIRRYCNEYDIVYTPGERLADYFTGANYLTDAKLQSLVAPSLRLSCIFSDEKNPEVSYAVFYSAFSHIPFTIEIQEKGVNSTNCYTYPDTSNYFTMSDGTKVAKSNLHMALVFSYDVTIYSFKSEFDNSKFDFIADYERSKPS